MKVLFFLSALCCLFFEMTKAQSKENFESKFEILNIDSIQSVYIVYAKRNDSVIKIVSKNENLNDCKPIFKGQFYELKVESFLKYSASKRHIGGVKYNGVLIKLEGDKVVWDLFVCEDLKGLCYIPSTSSTACKKKKQKKRLENEIRP